MSSKGSALRRLAFFLVGCVFAFAGLACVAHAVANVDDMEKPAKVVYSRGDMHDEGGYSLKGGFGVGLQAFFGMLFVGVGTGIAATSASTNPGIRRGFVAVLALAWHGVGIGCCWYYCSLAPALDAYPFLIVIAYEWLGLIPLALVMPKDGPMGRLRSAVWYAMGGGFLGAFAAAVIGGVVGGVAVLLSSASESEVVGTTWWLYASIGGCLATGAVFALRRLAGWEISSGDDEEEKDKSDEEEEEPQTPHSVLCRKCRMPIDAGIAECPHCRAPARARDVRRIGRMLAGVGILCAIGTYLGWGMLQSWLVGKGFNPTALSYLFWMSFLLGLLMIGVGSLLSSATPAQGSRGDSGGADDSERDIDKHELPYGIAERPMPEGDDLDILLPPQVGAYTRDPIEPPTGTDMPVYADYRCGVATVFVELGISNDAADAQLALDTAKTETDNEFPDVPQVFVKGWDIGCLRTANRLGAFMAWTRGRYYFSAHAKGGESDLDQFMESFPY